LRFSYLLCFEAIKRYQNFSVAAENLYISQSALSKQIKTLEEQLGVVLFDRGHTTIQLTPIGERISEHVEAILNEYDKMMLEARSYLENEKKKLKIASFYEMAQYGVADLLVNFEKNKPNFYIESKECAHSQMLQLLYNRQTDMIIGYLELWQKEKIETSYYTVPLRKDDLVLVAHERHPIGKKDSVSLTDVKDEIFCFPREDSSLFEFYKETCKSVGFAPKHTQSNVRLGTIKEYIFEGMRITIQTRIRATNYFHEPVFRLIDIKETPFLTLAIMTNNNLLSKIGKEFIEFAGEFYENFD